MKLNWSHILIIGMSAFIIFIVTMGIRMSTSNSELYESDYYKKGEEYGKRMDQEKIAKDVILKFNHASNSIEINYQSDQGTVEKVKCFKLSNAEDDMVIVPKDPSSATIALPLSKGIWVLEVYGEIKGKKFFKKLELTK